MTDKEYEHVITILKKIEMKIMKDYHDLCFKCRCDVMLWADVFEKFRNNSLKNYRLCPSHFLSAPGLSWDAMLKMTVINLELIPDPGMHIFLEKSTRSGISNRYSKAKKKIFKISWPKIRIKISKNLYGLQCLNFFQQVDSNA